MHFVVPQFIDVETKIIGPIAARQFIIILVSVGLVFVWYQLFSTPFFIVFSFVTASLGGALSFAKVNGQPMHYVLLNVVQTLRRPRLRIWKRTQYVLRELPDTETSRSFTVAPKVAATQSRLASLSLMVDTGGAYISEEMQPPGPPPPTQYEMPKMKSNDNTTR